MGLETREVIQKWYNTSMDHYIGKGYIFSKYGDKFLVNVTDLTKSSHALVNVRCDDCGKLIENVIWRNYQRSIQKEKGKYYCKACAMKKYGGLNKLTDEEIQKRVDEKLKWKILEIKRVNWNTYIDLIDNDGYMYYNINVSGINKFVPKKFNKSNIYTAQNINLWCELNNISIKLIDNYNGNNKNLKWQCLDCNKIFNRTWHNIQQNQSFCPHCGDGISYPNKFGRSIFEQLNINYFPEYTSNWTKDFRYDFGIEDLKIVIEFHGLQHFERTFETIGAKKLEEEQENDRLKKELAKANGFKYIEIDARYSKSEWIKNSVLNSELAQVFDLKQINWSMCHEIACKSLVKKVCDLWNNKIKNTYEIGKIISLNRNTVAKYLSQGAELNWCDYNPTEYNKKSIMQLSLNNEYVQEFESATEAYNKTGIHFANISACCHGKLKQTGGFIWKFKSAS